MLKRETRFYVCDFGSHFGEVCESWRKVGSGIWARAVMGQ